VVLHRRRSCKWPEFFANFIAFGWPSSPSACPPAQPVRPTQQQHRCRSAHAL
jgi:hypothetical protein